MGGRCVPFDVNAVCDCCGVAGAYDFMGDLLCVKCATGNDQEDVMGHDSDCAVHSEPAYPAGECNCSACDELHKLRNDLAAAKMELAAYKNAYEKAIFEWRDYGYEDCKNDNQTLDWIEYRVRELLAQEGGK